MQKKILDAVPGVLFAQMAFTVLLCATGNEASYCHVLCKHAGRYNLLHMILLKWYCLLSKIFT